MLKTAVIGLILAFMTTITAAAVQTPGPIVQGDGMHFYQIVTTAYQELTWTQANAAANSLPSYTPPGTSLMLSPHLVTITSAAEQAIVAGLPGALTQNLWMGLRQDPAGAEPGGGWSWVTDEPLVYANWDPTEPNNISGDEDYGEWHAGGWNDNINLGRATGYIVEYESVTPIPGVDVPGIEGVHIDPIADLQLFQAQLDAGYPVDVSGYVGFLTSTGSPAKPKINSLLIEVEKDGSGIWTPIGYWGGSPLASEVLTARHNLPGQEFFGSQLWVIRSTGAYVLRVTATFTGTDAAPYGTEDVTVTLLKPVVVEYPAAPAVATAILKDAGIGYRYDTGDVDKKGNPIYGNYIADVAAMMGSGPNDENGSWFMGIPKTEVDAYHDAVYNYLISQGAPLTPLP